MKISEILDKGADVIEHNGWHRGAFIEARPGVRALRDAAATEREAGR